MSIYKKGLHFTCQGCGNCCTGFSGFVWLKKAEIKKIADYLSLDQTTFLETYTYKTYGRISLKETLPSYDCIFFKNKKCLIYPVRPFQCVAFPFWPDNLKSAESWQNLKTSCPGIDQGTLHSQTEIEKWLENYQTDLA